MIEQNFHSEAAVTVEDPLYVFQADYSFVTLIGRCVP